MYETRDCDVYIGYRALSAMAFLEKVVRRAKISLFEKEKALKIMQNALS
ncbi:MAG: hypothetical protein Q7R51_01445 [bacterium]|nr:hypothetical protein [bacterium]